MGIRRCPNGHYYSEDRFESCPHCDQNSAFQKNHAYADVDVIGENSTVGFAPINTARPQPRPMAVPQITIDDDMAFGFPTPPRPPRPKMQQNEDVTVCIYQEETMVSAPLVGWLVQLSGSRRGTDFRIQSGRNMVRELCGVTTESDCALVYDAKSSKYWLVAGDDKQFFRINDAEVEKQTTPLSAKDVIEYKGEKYLFIPLCEEGFLWEKDA